MRTTMPRLLLCATLATLAACGSDSLPVSVESTLLSLTASGAVVGGHGKLRLSFTNPLGQAVEVALESSQPSLVQIPPSVTIPAGALLADVAYDATALGAATITAAYQDVTRRANATVVDAVRANSGATLRVENGATGSLAFGLNILVPDAITIPLVVADPSVADAPTSVTVPPFANQAAIYVKGKGVGVTTISTTLHGESPSAQVNVVDHARLSNVSSPRILEIGATARITVGLDALVAQTTPISITSSNPAVAAAPTLSVPIGSNAAVVDVPILGAGLTDLTFAVGASTYTMNLAGVTKARLVGLNANDNLTPGTFGSISAYLDANPAAPREILLSSSNPAVLTVPDRMLVLPGSTGGFAASSALSAGDAVLTATLDGVSLQWLVHVGNQREVFSLSLRSKRSMVGANNTLNVTIGAGNGFDQVSDLTLTSSDPSVATVPAQVSVPYSTSVAVTGLKVGKTTITGSANGRVTTVELEVVAAPGISGFDSYNVPVGNTYDAYLYLSALVPAGTPLSFTSSNPAVSPAPPPVTLSDSRTYVKFPLTGLSSGTALLTVNLGGTMRTAVIYVGGASQYPSYFSYLSTSSNTLQIGSSAYSTVSLSVPSPADMPVTLAASASGVVVLPQASTFIAAGSTQVSFPIVAVGAGSVDITVTAGGVQQSTTINVVSTPTFTLNMNASAGAGTIVLATLQSDCVLPANVSFVLASTGAAASVSQGSITLGPGPTSSSNSFVVNALAAGMTTITATTGGSTVISAPLTVTP